MKIRREGPASKTPDFTWDSGADGYEDLGAALARARLAGALLDRPWPGIASEASARAVQAAAVAASETPQLGYTTLLLPARRGGRRGIMERPPLVYGPLFDDQLVDRPMVRLPRGVLGVQPCLLFTIGRPYPHHEAIDRHTAISAVACCRLALALLGRRIEGAVPITEADAVADLALHVATIVGPLIADWSAAVRARREIALGIDGHVLGRLAFLALFDRAFAGLTGLAEARVADRSQLDAGTLVAAGARLPAFQVLPGQHISLETAGFEPITIRFA